MAKVGQGLHAQQVQQQVQTLSPQQVLVARLTELPLDGLRDRIEKELEDNQWLEKRADSPSDSHSTDADNGNTRDGADEREDFFDDGTDDGVPRDPNANSHSDWTQRDDTESFFDHLVAQLGEYELTSHETDIVRYIIGSLEDDGLLRTPVQQIVDELEIYQAIDTDEAEIEHLLSTVVQQMDPAGVGGRDLQECLVLQAQRNYQGEKRQQLLTLFQKRWDDFSHMRWDKIQQSMKLDDVELDELRRRVRKLTPRPGGSIGRQADEDNRTVTPDYFVTIDEDNKLHLQLNEGDLPRLCISDDAEVSLQMPTVTRADREALHYLRNQVQNAQFFIDAIAQRRRSMLLVMKAIIKLQRKFFVEGDVTLLKPMKMDDVATQTGLDISTVSRVASSKYVQTPHGMYSLRDFFTASAMKDNKEVSVRNVLIALQELVDAEDKKHPLSDEKLVSILNERGFAVARRTVAKYRTQLGIPESRLRS